MLEEQTLKYCVDQIELLSDDKPSKTVRDIAEQYRILPEGSPFPGYFDYSLTPYMIEIANCLDPSDPTRMIDIMKGGQLGASSGSTEAMLLFKTDLGVPGNVLYITATEKLVKDVIVDRIDPMFASAGIVYSSSSDDTPNRNKKTGNTAFTKSGKGWKHVYKSYGNARELRSVSYQIVILEEVDEMTSVEGAKKQGSLKSVAVIRTRAYAGREKVLSVSTPLLLESSEINKGFMEGSQEYYYIPCVHCNTLQRLVFGNLGWTFSNEEKTIVSEAYYTCEKCKQKMYNNDKKIFLIESKCEYRKHNENHIQNHRSFHISALYAPVGMTTWTDIAQDYTDSLGDPSKMQAFVNLTLGEPYAMTYNKQEPEALNSLKGEYLRRDLVLPPTNKHGNTPLITTMGVDVQGDRLECELLAHGQGNITWSLRYWVIKGDIKDHRTGAWQTLLYALSNLPEDLYPRRVLIDSGYLTEVVKSFCQYRSNMNPCSGLSTGIKRSNARFRIKQLTSHSGEATSALELVEIDTNSYKRFIYQNLLLRKDPITGELPWGLCIFPKDYDIKYFRMLQAETEEPEYNDYGKIIGSKFKNPGGKRNEALDCRVYALAAFDITALKICQRCGLDAINFNFVWEVIKERKRKQMEIKPKII